MYIMNSSHFISHYLFSFPLSFKKLHTYLISIEKYLYKIFARFILLYHSSKNIFILIFIDSLLSVAQKYVINGTNFVLKPVVYCDPAILSDRFFLFSYLGTVSYFWSTFSSAETAEEGTSLY